MSCATARGVVFKFKEVSGRLRFGHMIAQLVTQRAAYLASSHSLSLSDLGLHFPLLHIYLLHRGKNGCEPTPPTHDKIATTRQLCWLGYGEKTRRGRVLWERKVGTLGDSLPPFTYHICAFPTFRGSSSSTIFVRFLFNLISRDPPHILGRLPVPIFRNFTLYG